MQHNNHRPLLFYPQSTDPTSTHVCSSVANQQVNDYVLGSNSKQTRVSSPLVQTSDDVTIAMSNSHSHQPRSEVYMRCVTWSRDSHGLFDYESRQIAKRNIKTYTGGKIIRLNNDLEFINKALTAQEFDSSAKPLLVVNEKNGKYFVENDTLVSFTQQMENEKVQDEDVNNKMFIVVRNLKSSQAKNDYRLNKGDIIKLGRIKFKVKDFRTDSQPANLDTQNRRASCSPVKNANKGQTIMQDDDYWVGGDDFSEEAIEVDCGVVDATQSAEIQCKVCWSNEQTPQNPLLNSCKCDGSVRFIHYECLKHWLKQKMSKKEDQNIISYSWKQFECEICKKPYPYVFKSNGRKYRLVDVEVPEEKTFLWLESLTFEKNSSRMVHLVMPDKEKGTFRLGRGHESDVRVSDISVSRCHAILKYEADNQFYLEDNLSKFGTLVLAKSAIELDVDQTVAVQIGRSVISFMVKPILPEQPQIQEQSPIVQQAKSESVEEILRQKIEETNQRINRLMNSALINGPSESSYYQNEEPIPIKQDVNQLNFQEKRALNDTLLQFEQRIQSVEQRLAERDSNFKTLISGGANQGSPQRIQRSTYKQMEEEMLRNQRVIAQNEIKYRQLQTLVQNPEQEKPQHLQMLQQKYGRSEDNQEDQKEESFDEFVNLNEDDDDQPLRLKHDSENYQQFSQLSRDHTQDRNSLLPTKHNTQYGNQFLNGTYIAENTLFSQIENQDDKYYRPQTPEKVDFKNVQQTTSSQIKRSSTSYNANLPQSRYYQQQQESPQKRYNHQMKYEQYGKANTTKQRDTQPLSSSSPWRMLSEEYDSAGQSQNSTQGLRTFKVEQSVYRNNGHGVVSANQDKYNQSPIKRTSQVGAQQTSTPNKKKDSSIGRSVAQQSSYAQNSANRRRKQGAGVPMTASGNPSQTLYSRQMDNKPQMRF